MGQENKNLISAQEVSKKFNISYQLVNYYTNIGLFSVSAIRGNRRFYDADQAIEVFKKIKDFRECQK